MEPARLHQSSEKVHLAAGWTRYNADGAPILSNRVTYIVTLVGGSWGIQARFGTDFPDENETAESAEAAVGTVRKFVEALGSDDLASCARLARYPFTDVGVGEVHQLGDETALEEWIESTARISGSVQDVAAAQVGTNGVNVAVSYDRKSRRALNGLYLVAKGEGLWRIAGYSAIEG